MESVLGGGHGDPFLEAGDDAEKESASTTVRPMATRANIYSAEEGRVVKGQRDNLTPSKEEYENHMRTHIPYRKWCNFV